ncbi:amidohydrolase family protein [Candidatus Thiodictyon syntrophicum]|jgi:predicted TIM-barrel fold metal-dependent hydrolase|uniref:Amidohydrolase-related domain-containing protein n=1 Tax=Candidatus Thiodictyon syntrophicum TaxID=1166950 RepID=A0A2K8UHJ2_9GAMM|nr:amidohydrolase family protein [Candidatus Thiodictyon syntrophicum]AUB85053.1 hypothetical protein THSYN_29405 [Candidatus Thiodictyon syntrophicum]
MNADTALPDGFSIFDVHVHCGTYGENACFPPVYLEELCGRLPMERFVCAPFSWDEQTERLKAGFSDVFPAVLQDRVLNWLWVSPVRESAIDILKMAQCPDGYVGIKLHPYADQYDMMLSLMRPVITAAERWSVPVAVHTGNRGCMPKDVSRCFPRGFSQALILFHARPFQESLDAAKKSSSVYLEFSFCDPDSFACAFDAIGPNRLLFGSDYPVQAIYHPGLDVISSYCHNVQKLLAAAARVKATNAFFRDNACAVFHMSSSRDNRREV